MLTMTPIGTVRNQVKTPIVAIFIGPSELHID